MIELYSTIHPYMALKSHYSQPYCTHAVHHTFIPCYVTHLNGLKSRFFFSVNVDTLRLWIVVEVVRQIGTSTMVECCLWLRESVSFPLSLVLPVFRLRHAFDKRCTQRSSLISAAHIGLI